MEKPDNIATKTRYLKMRKMLPTDCSNLTILDIGAGKYPISKGVSCKKVISLDGENKYNPDIMVDLNCEKIPLKDSSIDILIAGEIIEHMFNPTRFLSEINRVLKKGGLLILSTPNICSFKNRIRMLFNLIPEHSANHLQCSNKDIHHLQDHVGDFNSRSIKCHLNNAGFRLSKLDSNGVIFRGKRIFPLVLTPSSFGEVLILKAKKL